MYLVEDQRLGAIYLVFTWEDPRKDGFDGRLIEDVSLEYDEAAVHEWRDGQARPDVCVGRRLKHPKQFRIFKYKGDAAQAGYELIPGNVVVFGSWKEYLRLILTPPISNNVSNEELFSYLDKLDAGWRTLQRDDDAPLANDRDAVAEWLAKKHLSVDSGIREVWYLPTGAPTDEIRLLELSDRIVGAEEVVEPIDFGLDVEGIKFRLVVADITSEQLERFKRDPSRLPLGWSLEGNRRLSRRGA